MFAGSGLPALPRLVAMSVNERTSHRIHSLTLVATSDRSMNAPDTSAAKAISQTLDSPMLPAGSCDSRATPSPLTLIGAIVFPIAAIMLRLE